MRIQIKKGETLYEALQKQNIVLDRPCGGMGSCGGCAVEVKGFGKIKSCQFRLPGTYEVTMPKMPEFTVIDNLVEQKEEEKLPFFDIPMVALDIGTTTVAWSIYYKGKKRSGGFVNPQRAFGADVMSRMKSASDGYERAMYEDIHSAVEETIDAAIDDMFPEEKKAQKSYSMCIAANTTMLHIWNNWNCEGLGKAPYTPLSLDLYTCVEKQHRIWQLPGFSCFVGADIVAGVYALDMHKSKEPVLLLDLGTNGEMVLGNQNKMFVSSAAAGPAFEGTPLALEIHASGIMELLVEMRQKQIMDETGYMGQECYKGISQEDVRQIQMAKSAIYAGILLLTEAYEITVDQIAKVYLAGGMGYYLNPEHAVEIGLLPKAFLGKIQPVGNSSLAGARKAICASSEDEMKWQQEVTHIAKLGQEVVLATHPKFMDYFMEHMEFNPC